LEVLDPSIIGKEGMTYQLKSGCHGDGMGMDKIVCLFDGV